MKFQKKHLIGVFFLFILVLAGGSVLLLSRPKLTVAEYLIDLLPNAGSGRVVTPASTEELRDLFSQVHYTAVPRIYITRFPDDFLEKGSSILFEKALTPLVLRENEILEKQRQILLILRTKIEAKKPLTQKEQVFFDTLAEQYESSLLNTPQSQIDDLLAKVDRVPVPLVVMQFAYETGWLKKQMESPYGVFEWADDENYVLKKYNSLLEATHDFIFELNASGPMHQFRMARQNLIRMPEAFSASTRLFPYLRQFHPDQVNYINQAEEVLQAPGILFLEKAQLIPYSPKEKHLFQSENPG